MNYAIRKGPDKMNTKTKYPVGGPREPVYALMRQLGFSESNWSDKFWQSADGIQVSIYGAGSQARIMFGGVLQDECALDNLSERIDAFRNMK